MIRLSIIIPTYNCNTLTTNLLSILDKQITNEVQVIVIDDGSEDPFKTNYEWVELYRKENGGVSSARNYGIEKVKGKYLAYIDGDDEVADNYISSILEKIKTDKFDFLYMSWRTLSGGWDSKVKINSINDKFPTWNCCVWNRVYRFEPIKEVRFVEKKLIAEDADYIRTCEPLLNKKSFVSDYMYFYRVDNPQSLTKRFANGELDFDRIVLHYPRITKNMTYLIDKAKRYNETSEVIVMTDYNELPELQNYAMVITPQQIKGTELIGEATNLFHKIYKPIKTQVIIYTGKTFEIGGIETFIYNFCMTMKKYYDICVLYDEMDIDQINRLIPYVKVEKNNNEMSVICDTIIVNRITDKVPKNIRFKQKVQMVHCCKLMKEWNVPDADVIVPVSNTVKESYGLDSAKIINNIVNVQKPKKVLRLISATRLTFEKGKDRMIKLANMLNDAEIPFIWTVFTNDDFGVNIPGIVIMRPTLDISDWIADSDYLVQLSDSEAFCYSIFESLMLGTPVITTPLPVLNELGFEDGKFGFDVGFDLEKIDIEKIYKSNLKFKFNYDNDAIVQNWREILGNTTPKHDYVFVKTEDNSDVKVIVIQGYKDTVLKHYFSEGSTFIVDKDRAEILKKAGVVKIIR